MLLGVFVLFALGATAPAMGMVNEGGSGTPWIASDLPDYAPGATVTLNGGNWTPGESVHINVNDDVGQSWTRNVDVPADAEGNIADSFNLPEWFVATYTVTATGASGSVATASFTDGDLRFRASRPPTDINTAMTIAVGGVKLFSSNDCSGASTSSNANSFTTGGGGGNGFVSPSPPMNPASGTSFSAEAPSSITVGATTYSFSSWTGDPGKATLVSTSGATGCFLSTSSGQTSLTANYVPDAAAPTAVSISINDGAAWTNSSTGGVTVDLAATDNVGVSSYRLAETQAGLTGATSVAVTPAEANFSRSDVAFTLTGAEAASKAVWLRVCDAANNCTDASDTIGWDKTAPVITDLGPTTLPNGAGWYNADVTNRFKATDGLSGLNASCQTAFPDVSGERIQSKTTSGEGTAVTVDSDSCTDAAGNTAAAKTSAAFKIDTTAPVLTASAVKGTAPGFVGATAYTENDWTNQDVKVSFSCTDSGGSGVAAGSPSPASQTFTTEGTHTANSSCSDTAGNSDTESFGVKIDTTAPTVTCQSPAPVFMLGQANAQVFADVTDGLSGPLTSPVSSIADTSLAAGGSVNVTGQDKAGNSTTASCAYHIASVTFGQPIEAPMVMNIAKLGRVVPVKVTLRYDNVVVVGPGGLPVYVSGLSNVNCATAAAADDVEMYAAAGSSNTGNQFRWESAGFWMYNFDTSAFLMKVGNCYRVNVHYGGSVAGGVASGGSLAGYFLMKTTK